MLSHLSCIKWKNFEYREIYKSDKKGHVYSINVLIKMTEFISAYRCINLVLKREGDKTWPVIKSGDGPSDKSV